MDRVEDKVSYERIEGLKAYDYVKTGYNKKLLRSIIVSERNLGRSYASIAKELKQNYGVDMSRQSVAGIYKRATSTENISKDRFKVLKNPMICWYSALGYSEGEIKWLIEHEGADWIPDKNDRGSGILGSKTADGRNGEVEGRCDETNGHVRDEQDKPVSIKISISDISEAIEDNGDVIKSIEDGITVMLKDILTEAVDEAWNEYSVKKIDMTNIMNNTTYLGLKIQPRKFKVLLRRAQDQLSDEYAQRVSNIMKTVITW